MILLKLVRIRHTITPKSLFFKPFPSATKIFPTHHPTELTPTSIDTLQNDHSPPHPSPPPRPPTPHLLHRPRPNRLPPPLARHPRPRPLRHPPLRYRHIRHLRRPRSDMDVTYASAHRQPGSRSPSMRCMVRHVWSAAGLVWAGDAVC